MLDEGVVMSAPDGAAAASEQLGLPPRTPPTAMPGTSADAADGQETEDDASARTLEKRKKMTPTEEVLVIDADEEPSPKRQCRAVAAQCGEAGGGDAPEAVVPPSSGTGMVLAPSAVPPAVPPAPQVVYPNEPFFVACPSDAAVQPPHLMSAPLQALPPLPMPVATPSGVVPTPMLLSPETGGQPLYLPAAALAQPMILGPESVAHSIASSVMSYLPGPLIASAAAARLPSSQTSVFSMAGHPSMTADMSPRASTSSEVSRSMASPRPVSTASTTLRSYKPLASPRSSTCTVTSPRMSPSVTPSRTSSSSSTSRSSASSEPPRDAAAGEAAGTSRPPSKAGGSHGHAPSARPSPRPSARPPFPGAVRSKNRRFPPTEGGTREGLMDCVKHVPENFQPVLRQHIMMQLALSRTQAAMGNSLVPHVMKAEMIASYQPWVILTYGDAAKTKTITLAKYARIVRTLRGEEINSAENSKFRFWVRSKGFRLGLPESCGARRPADEIIGSYGVDCSTGRLYICADEAGLPLSPMDAPPLYVPTAASRTGDDAAAAAAFKRVAVVENFFDIIYSVHVDIEGRGSKHAGQKRTYRTITDSYAFLPREAVTRFLLGCTECNRCARSPGSPPSGLGAAAPADSDSDGQSSGASGTSAAWLSSDASTPPSPPPAETSVSSVTSACALGPGGGELGAAVAGADRVERSYSPQPASPASDHFAALYRYSASIGRPFGSADILSGRSGPSAFRSPSESRSDSTPAGGHAQQGTATDEAARPPPSPGGAKAEDGRVAQEDADQSNREQVRHSSAADATAARERGGDRHARTSFSIENISKSSRRSPVPEAAAKTSTAAKDPDDLFLVPRPPKSRASSHLLPPAARSDSPAYRGLEYGLLASLDAERSPDLASQLRVPVPLRAMPPSMAKSAPSIMAGMEPPENSGLFGLLLKSGAGRGYLPSAIPEPDLRLPLSATYLKNMRGLGYNAQDALKMDIELSLYQHLMGVPLKVVDDYL